MYFVSNLIEGRFHLPPITWPQVGSARLQKAAGKTRSETLSWHFEGETEENHFKISGDGLSPNPYCREVMCEIHPFSCPMSMFKYLYNKLVAIKNRVAKLFRKPS
jgi:hypothetical protein